MKKIFEKITLAFEKVPIIAYALIALIKSFLISAVLIAVFYFILWITGIYSKFETAFDLKYNSPMILVPLWAFVALFVLCLMVGFLMYFHKYKRGKAKTAFYNAVAPLLDKK
jgi:FtsH-binding integral membrane protein